MKLIIAPNKAPYPIIIGPREKVAVCQAPFGIKGVIIGIIKLLTIDWINDVAAIPIIKAIDNGITLYSFKNSLNSLSKGTVIIFIKSL